MSALGPAEIRARLRHRRPALAIERELQARARGGRRFLTVERGAWHPAELLDAAAQAAGLCARGDADPAELSLLVVAYEGVRWPVSLSAQRFIVEVRPLRAFLSMHQLAVEVRESPGAGVEAGEGEGGGEGELCLEAQVTLAREGG